MLTYSASSGKIKLPCRPNQLQVSTSECNLYYYFIDYFSFAESLRNNGNKAIEAILEIKNTINIYHNEEATITKQ